MKASRLVALYVLIPEELKEALKEQAQAQRRTITAVVRLALEQYIGSGYDKTAPRDPKD